MRAVVKSGIGGAEAQAAKDALLRAESEALGRAAEATARAADLRANPQAPLQVFAQRLADVEAAHKALTAQAVAKDAVAAKKLLASEETLTAARARVAAAAADPAKAAKMARSQIEAYERTAAAERAMASNVRLTLDAANTDNLVRAPLLGAGKTVGSSGIVSKGAGPSGIVGGLVNVNEFSLPFSNQTYTLTASNFGLRPVMKFAGAAAKPYTLSNLQKVVDEGRVMGLAARDVLSPGQQVAYLAQRLGKPIDTTYRHVHDFIGRTLGTRVMQPMIAKLSTLTKPLDRSAGDMDNLFPLHRVIDQKWIELDKVAPELWQNYQSAVERFFAQTAANDQYLRRSMIGILEQAQGIAKARKAAAKAGKVADPVLAKQYADPAYGVQDIINEAADAVETGAGVLDPASGRYRADLAAFLPGIQTLRDNVVNTLGKSHEEVTQSLVAMSRFLKGDEALDGQIGQAMAEIDAEIARLTAKQGRAKTALNAVAPMVGVRTAWFGKAIDELDPARLGVTLDRYLKATGQREVAPAMLRTAIMSLVNNDAAKATDILRRIAMAHGKSAPADGVNILAGMLSGKLSKRPNAAVLDAIREIMAESDEVVRLSELFRSGKMTTAQEVDALMALAKQTTRIELAQARSLLGDDGFQKAILLIDALDEPNIVPALVKAIGRPQEQVAQGIANVLRARKGTKVMADTARKSGAEFRKMLTDIDVNLPPNISIEQWFDEADTILRSERIAQAVQNVGEQAAKDAVFQRLKLSALGYNNNGVLDAFTEQKFRDAANEIVDAAIRVKNVPTFPEDASLISAREGLRVAQEELAAAQKVLADFDANPPAAPKLTKTEQKAIDEATAKVAAAQKAYDDAVAAVPQAPKVGATKPPNEAVYKKGTLTPEQIASKYADNIKQARAENANLEAFETKYAEGGRIKDALTDFLASDKGRAADPVDRQIVQRLLDIGGEFDTAQLRIAQAGDGVVKGSDRWDGYASAPRNPGEPTTVVIKGSSIRKTGQGQDKFDHTLIHEAVHVATQILLHQVDIARKFPASAPSGPAFARISAAYDELDAVFKYAKQAAKTKGVDTKAIYGFTNLHEFASEALSNKNFQTILRNVTMPAQKKSAWSKFVEGVAKLVGITPQSTDAFTETLARFERLVETNTAVESRELFWYTMGYTTPPTNLMATADDAVATAKAALDDAQAALKTAVEEATKAAAGRTTKKQRAKLEALVLSKQQAVAAERAGVNAAENAASAARVQWQQMMSGYIERTTGDLQQAFQQFASGGREAKIAASATQTLAQTGARITELTAQREALAGYRSKQGLRTLASMPEGGVRMANVKPPPETRVVYVPVSEIDNIIATTIPQPVMTFKGEFKGNVFEVNGTPVQYVSAPTKDHALVAVTPDGTVEIEAVRTSGATKGALTEQITDYMRYNPPVDYTGKLKYRELEAWERTLWSGFRQLTAGLPEERVVEAAFLALRDAPGPKPGVSKSALDKIEGVTPQRLSTRFGDVAPDIRPVVEEFSALLKSYETMFTAHGMDFAADPLRLMRDWGVTSYVPHIASDKNLIAAGKFSSQVMAAGSAGTSRVAPSLDRTLSTAMAQRHERRIGGTVAEIMSVAQDPTKALTLDPVSIISRYAQANGAIAAQDFMLMALRTGVIRAIKAEPGLSVSQIAARDGMVPLFSRPSAVRDIDVLFGGTAQDWAGAGVDATMLDAARTQLREWSEGTKSGKLKDISPFASWMGEIPAVQQAINIEEAIIDIRTMQFKAGQPLLDIGALHDDIVNAAIAAGDPLTPKAAWKATAVKVNELAAKAGSDIRVVGDYLMTWFDEGSRSWQLYIPNTVAQSMADTLDTTAYAQRVLGEATGLAGLKKIGDAINRVYKPWYTITQMAHHVGNAIGNIFNNVLDLGVGGALNPKTNILSSQLTMAASYVEQYGSLSKAKDALSAPRLPTESDVDFFTRTMRHESFKALGLEKALLNGIDLGDGVVREADTAMRILREQGIHAGGHSTYLDMDRFETDMAEVYALSSNPEAVQKMKRTFYAARDSIIFTMPMAFSGSLMGLGIVMPPRLGSMIAGFVETQARTANFIANMKRGGSVEQATQHVNKFLFNYNDLTSVQKTWMRTLFPFFTWTFKNTYLQASMALEKPYMLQLYGKMLVFDASNIVSAYERDIEFKDRFPAHPAKRYSLNWRLPHARYRLRIPVPEKPTMYLEGFRTPLESAAENIGMLGAAGEGLYNLLTGTKDPTSSIGSRFRILSQGHFAIRFAFESAVNHSLYYDRPLSQLDNAKPIAQTLTAFNRLYTAGVPVLSPMAGMLHDALVQMSAFGTTQRFNSSRGIYEDTPYASPGFVHTYMNMPFSQMLRTMMGAADVYQTSIAEGPSLPEGGRALYRTPDWVRYLDALSGIGLTQEDPLVRIRMVERDARDMQLRAMEEGGGVLTFDKPFIPKK